MQTKKNTKQTNTKKTTKQTKQTKQTDKTMFTPRGRLRKFIFDHRDEASAVRELSDGSRAMNIICAILDNPWFDQAQIATQFDVGKQYISQLMRDVEVIGTPLDYAKARHEGKPVTRSRVATPQTEPKNVHRGRGHGAPRTLTHDQLTTAKRLSADKNESLRARCRADALLMMHENPYLSYAAVADAISANHHVRMPLHEVIHSHYTLQFTGSVDAVCHGRLYGSAKIFEKNKNITARRRPRGSYLPMSTGKAVEQIKHIAQQHGFNVTEVGDAKLIIEVVE